MQGRDGQVRAVRFAHLGPEPHQLSRRQLGPFSPLRQHHNRTADLRRHRTLPEFAQTRPNDPPPLATESTGAHRFRVIGDHREHIHRPAERLSQRVRLDMMLLPGTRRPETRPQQHRRQPGHRDNPPPLPPMRHRPQQHHPQPDRHHHGTDSQHQSRDPPHSHRDNRRDPTPEGRGYQPHIEYLRLRLVRAVPIARPLFRLPPS